MLSSIQQELWKESNTPNNLSVIQGSIFFRHDELMLTLETMDGSTRTSNKKRSRSFASAKENHVKSMSRHGLKT